MSTMSGEASEVELDLSQTSDVENRNWLEVGPDDGTEHTADSDGEATATGKVPSALDAVMNEPSSEPESDIDVQCGG